MLEDYLRRHEVDIALLQEVTSPRINAIQNYTSYLNIRTHQRGTAIPIKNGITIANVKRLPSGRGIAALFQGTRIINVYAPSGAEKRDARERFYTTDITPLLPLTSHLSYH
jgi:exonuclease III